ncbi:hypothetical protein ACIQLJ_15720 [Microbacterium sp. NPDC091313]
MKTAAWEELWPESRHLLHVVAVMRDCASDDVAASHHSAAALHALPLYRSSPRRAQVTTPRSSRISSGDDVFRHVHRLPDEDVTMIGGVRCTTLARTVFDLARVLTAEAALAAADAAMRRVALSGQTYDQPAADRWRGEMAERVLRASGARGIRQARWITELMDGRAHLPGESVSRLHLVRLGFHALPLQVPVRAPGGGWYFVDIGLEEARAWGEFDGTQKYLDEAMRSGRSLEAVLLAEKQREDWIRGTTGRAVVRWDDTHIVSASALGARLASFGIHPPR